MKCPYCGEEMKDGLLGSGHSIGLLAEGKNLEETRAELARGKRLLEQTLYTQATIACVPEEQWEEWLQEADALYSTGNIRIDETLLQKATPHFHTSF